jgi:hypothetical protein
MAQIMVEKLSSGKAHDLMKSLPAEFHESCKIVSQSENGRRESQGREYCINSKSTLRRRGGERARPPFFYLATR